MGISLGFEYKRAKLRAPPRAPPIAIFLLIATAVAAATQQHLLHLTPPSPTSTTHGRFAEQHADLHVSSQGLRKTTQG